MEFPHPDLNNVDFYMSMSITDWCRDVICAHALFMVSNNQSRQNPNCRFHDSDNPYCHIAKSFRLSLDVAQDVMAHV